MKTFSEIGTLREQLTERRCAGDKIGLVPTMGNLHDGHLALVRKAKVTATCVVVSIFVNPMQFDRETDLDAYPRTLEQDLIKLRDVGVDMVFLPDVSILYPDGDKTLTRVEVPEITTILEGAKRPGHFTGVSTVVNKLFNIVQPDMAVFGDKDFQQLMVIKKMVTDLNLPVNIQSLSTVRETDGLAMSSRNTYLTGDERLSAPGLYEQLQWAGKQLKEADFHNVCRKSIDVLKAKGFNPEYFEIRNANDLSPVKSNDTDLVILVAAWLGKARLIDNLSVNLKC